MRSCSSLQTSFWILQKSFWNFVLLKLLLKTLISKYSRNFIDHTKHYARDALKTASKRAI